MALFDTIYFSRYEKKKPKIIFLCNLFKQSSGKNTERVGKATVSKKKNKWNLAEILEAKLSPCPVLLSLSVSLRLIIFV